MTIGIIKEKNPETRVAMVPETIRTLKTTTALRFMVEANAGETAGYSNADYQDAGAEILAHQKDIVHTCEIILSIQPFYEGNYLAEPKIFIGIFNPLGNFDHLLVYQERPITAYSLDLLPRNTLAQSMDVLSSMASLAGYKAVLKAAAHAPYPLPMFTTAAGTIKPAQVLVLGAGVAGLQAIATAKRLGAKVQAYDIRSSSKEEVKSLGARFIEIEGALQNTTGSGYAVDQDNVFKQKQKTVLHEHIMRSDIVITTALVPGKKAPVLIEKNSVEQMRTGSVIVDLASSGGGNCELTKNDETIIHQGVHIIGDSFLVRELPASASKLLSANYAAFLKYFMANQLAEKDEILDATRILHKGKIVHPSLLKLMEV